LVVTVRRRAPPDSTKLGGLSPSTAAGLCLEPSVLLLRLMHTHDARDSS